jgi:hypothetical protein
MLVKDVEFEKLSDDIPDVYYLPKLPKNNIFNVTENSSFPKIEFEKEEIKFYEFVDKYGNEYKIGWTEKVEQTIGVPLSSLSELSQINISLKYQNYKLECDVNEKQKKLEKINEKLGKAMKANLFKRLKWVFKGISF